MQRMKTCLLMLLVGTALAADWNLPVGGKNGEVEFLATGRPSALKIRGKIKEDAKDALTGKLQVTGANVTGTAKLALDMLDTGIDLRNKHMKEKYLETGKFPTAEV